MLEHGVRMLFSAKNMQIFRKVQKCKINVCSKKANKLNNKMQVKKAK